MKTAWLLGVGLAILVPTNQAAQSAQAYRPLAVSPMCITSETEGAATEAKAIKPPPMTDAFGNGAFKIDGSPEGQRWFDYGLQLAWAFNHEEGTAAFAEAMRLDPNCGMCAWGYAWSLGPTINYPLEPAQLVKAREAAAKAQTMLANGSERDRELAAALVARYAGKGDDKAFAKAMDALATKYPAEDTIWIWAGDAWMIAQQPARSMPILETVLARSGSDAGAIHFYIHASEWVGSPGKAEVYADRLQGVAPGASHLIHMPSHTYYQIGRYKDAARANLDAMDVDAAWVKRTEGPEDLFKLWYYGHNVSFAMGGAMMAGDAPAALKIGGVFRASNPEKGNAWAQYSAGRGWFAYGRFGDIDQLLATARPADPMARALWRYARGEALSRRGEAAGVRAEAAALIAGRPGIVAGDSKDFVVMADIAHEVLLGRAAMLDNNPRQAARHYYKASLMQERELGESRDPPAWWYPVRRSYAAALLASGQTDKALKETDKVLARWPHDPLTLVVASRAEAAKGRADVASERMKQAGREWVGASLGGFLAGQI
jgi:tetratricopeptide (TPR) repeat protein